MLDSDEWTSERRVMLLAAGSLLSLPLLFVAMAIHMYLAAAFSLSIGMIHLICTLSYHGDAKKTKERTGKKPRWLLYTIGAMLFSNFVVAPIYLLNWRGT